MRSLASGRGARRAALLALAPALLLAAVALLGTGSAGATSAPPCTPKLTKIDGHKSVVNCGPATAVLKLNGRTYHFKNGFCQDSHSAGAELDLDLGTLVAGAQGNAGRSYLALLIPTADIDGSVFEADSGGKQLTGDNLITYSGSAMKGSFKSDHTSSEEEFTGAWNCHGVLWHAP